MKKILVLGDYEADARWHPLSNMEPLLNVLAEEYDLTVRDNYSKLTLEELKSYDLCINYIDNWEEKGSQKAQDAICEYVYGGGRMLTLHNGIIMKKSPKLLQLQGGRFVGHEAYCRLEYRAAKCSEFAGICQNLLFQKESTDQDSETIWFSLEEEPYQYLLEAPGKLDIFLEYCHKNRWYPAGWRIFCGSGEVIYLAPGHDRNTFLSDAYICLIKKVLTELQMQ